MLVRTRALPEFVIVEASSSLPRFWATVWALQLQGLAQSANTRKLRLRHIDAFYAFCDGQFGLDALDAAISSRNARAVGTMTEAFYLELTGDPAYTTTDAQRWEAVRGFVQNLARLRAPGDEAWGALSSKLYALGRIRPPMKGQIRFVRALPATTLSDVLAVANPESARNPFRGPEVRQRNWLVLNLLLLCGLRRGEALLLAVDALKHDVDDETGELRHWLDVTSCYDDDDARSTTPSMKTKESHRQIPVSKSLARLIDVYVAECRQPHVPHSFLLTASTGAPLSAESVTKMVSSVWHSLSDGARKKFNERSGGKSKISPHDLRHTCATIRYRMFLSVDRNRDLALQRMRAFFGWTIGSKMPEHYARAAVGEDLQKAWNGNFSDRLDVLRAAAR